MNLKKTNKSERVSSLVHIPFLMQLGVITVRMRECRPKAELV